MHMARSVLASSPPVNAQNNAGQTPLMAAVVAGSSEIVVLLLKNGADCNLPDAQQCHPLIAAATRASTSSPAHLTIALALVEARGVALTCVDGKTQNTCMHIAVEQNLPSLVDKLLSMAPAGTAARKKLLESQNKDGRAAIHSAIMAASPSIQVIRTLIGWSYTAA